MTTLTFNGPGSPRLDRFILQALPGLPRSALYKFWRHNKIKLNRKRAPLETRLAPGDEVRLFLPPGGDNMAPLQAGAEGVLDPLSSGGPAATPAHTPALRILYEDEQLLAVDKPAGLLSADEKRENRDSLLRRVRQYLAAGQQACNGTAAASGGPTDPAPQPPVYAALCHRLDVGTSGVLLVAKTPVMLDFVSALIRQRKLQKTYLGVTVGRPTPPQGTLKGYLRKDSRKGMVHLVQEGAAGAKYAETHYNSLAYSGRLALLKLLPATGRTHQLRAQLAAAGTPLLGDSKYGNNAINRELRCRYQCLCAAEICFPPVEEEAFASYGGLCIRCQEPWYLKQIQNGTLR